MKKAMTTRYRIQELRDGLRVQVWHEMPPYGKVLLALFAGLVVGIGSAAFVEGRWWFLVAIFVAVASFAADITTKRAKLTATNVEFITEGNFGTRKRSRRIVCTGDVRWLEFWKGPGIGDVRFGYCGLYAVMPHGSVCILPFLSQQDTMQVILAIEKAFPGLTERWRAQTQHSSSGGLG
jgi:hypothetical protein